MPAIKHLILALVLCLIAHGAFAVDAGEPAPPLATRLTDSQAFDLKALRGHPVIVHYWATWCGPCRAEMPVLDAFYQRYHSHGLAMIAVSIDNRHARDEVLQMARQFHFPVAMLGDADSDGFGTPGQLPVTYVIDSRGVVRRVFQPGESTLSIQQLTDAVMPLL